MLWLIYYGSITECYFLVISDSWLKNFWLVCSYPNSQFRLNSPWSFIGTNLCLLPLTQNSSLFVVRSNLKTRKKKMSFKRKQIYRNQTCGYICRLKFKVVQKFLVAMLQVSNLSHEFNVLSLSWLGIYVFDEAIPFQGLILICISLIFVL